MVDWRLACLPLAVSIWHWWVLWKHAGEVPVEQVWVVLQGLHVVWVIVEEDWAVELETTAKTSDHEPDGVAVGDKASGIEILDWQLTDHQKTEGNTDLGAGSVVGWVKVRLVDWSGHLAEVAVTWEPRSQDGHVTLSLWGEGWKLFLKSVLGQTEANKLIVLNVLRNLWVHLSSLEIIISIL